MDFAYIFIVIECMSLWARTHLAQAHTFARLIFGYPFERLC